MTTNGVMLQGYHWFLRGDDSSTGGDPLWVFLRKQADHLRAAGFDAIWLPPQCKAKNARGSNGYDVYDYYDLGEFDQGGDERTKFGTKQDLHDLVNALHGYKRENGNLVKDGNKRYIQVIGDVVLNHKDGDPENGYWQAIRVEKGQRTVERWGDGYQRGMIEVRGCTQFVPPSNPKRRSYSTFEWHAKHFDGVSHAESIRQNGHVFKDPADTFVYRFLMNEDNYDPQHKSWDDWVSLEKGNYDYLMYSDLDYGRWDVREEMKGWGTWLVNEVGLDGVRLDAVKHINAGYLRDWTGHVRHFSGKSLFAVGELYTMEDVGPYHSFLNEVTQHGDYPQRFCLFDFPLRTKLRNLSWMGSQFDLSSLYANTLTEARPTDSVTFVENHDKEWGRESDSHVRHWVKPIAYAYILLRECGYPCVFFADYFGSVSEGHHEGYPSGREYLDLLIKLRKQFALGQERYYPARDKAGWIRMGFVDGARGAMAVVVNTGFGVKSVRMDTGRCNRRFYHLATIKYVDGRYLVVRNRYNLFGEKAEGLYTDHAGWADFLADGGAVTVWLEDGVGLG